MALHEAIRPLSASPFARIGHSFLENQTIINRVAESCSMKLVDSIMKVKMLQQVREGHIQKMHELSLYGAVASAQHHRVTQQLTGVACMQPRNVQEVHLVFKTRVPPGLEKVQGTGGSSSNAQQQQELQRIKNMLQSPIYLVKLVGTIEISSTSEEDSNISWILEFKDTPEVAKQPISTRLVSRIDLEDGDLTGFLDLFGLEYVNRYLVEGQVFYAQDTSLLLHRIYQLPKAQNAIEALDISRALTAGNLPLLDTSGAYILHAKIDIIDGNSQDQRERASRQLFTLRDNFKSEVELLAPDRLALDTKIQVPRRRD